MVMRSPTITIQSAKIGFSCHEKGPDNNSEGENASEWL
jgi:hypothetical protein